MTLHISNFSVNQPLLVSRVLQQFKTNCTFSDLALKLGTLLERESQDHLRDYSAAKMTYFYSPREESQCPVEIYVTVFLEYTGRRQLCGFKSFVISGKKAKSVLNFHQKDNRDSFDTNELNNSFVVHQNLDKSNALEIFIKD
uniref:Uncharacterized protein n=1 Tax=Vespula pensylvanica TaxID=30213 RepID=A0A834P597_VESPE|nr:hypothetical protein H0235_005702 [Vespula pensylvanica]